MDFKLRFSDPVQRKIEIRRLLWIAVGALIYSFFMNYFIVPMGMYSGGFMGVAQIIRTIINQVIGISTGSFDYAGIISMAMNVPLFFIANKSVGKMYLFRTVFALSVMTFFLSVIPIPSAKIIDDMLASAIIGGAGCGFGGGMIFRNGGSGGGMDLVGAVMIQRTQNASISTVTNTVNAFVFGVMFFLFGADLVIYSIIYAFVYPLVVDRVFSQNINVEVHIITNKDDGELQRDIFADIGRGITKWIAIGAYTGAEKEIYYVLVNKYEMSRLRAIVREHDPNAMVIENAGVRINGHFEKRIE